MNPRPGGERRVDPRRRSMELARADILHRMEAATGGPHREMLQRALSDLEARLREMRAPDSAQE